MKFLVSVHFGRDVFAPVGFVGAASMDEAATKLGLQDLGVGGDYLASVDTGKRVTVRLGVLPELACSNQLIAAIVGQVRYRA